LLVIAVGGEEGTGAGAGAAELPWRFSVDEPPPPPPPPQELIIKLKNNIFFSCIFINSRQ
jgi:hypothetical protein